MIELLPGANLLIDGRTLIDISEQVFAEIAREFQIPKRLLIGGALSHGPETEASVAEYYGHIRRQLDRVTHRNRGARTKIMRMITPRKSKGYRRHLRRMKEARP